MNPSAARACRFASRQARLSQNITRSKPPTRLTCTPTTTRLLHTSPPLLTKVKPQNPDPTQNKTSPRVSPSENIGRQRFSDFDLGGKVYIVTGGAQGLGLTLAEALVEAGGKVYCLDRHPSPSDPEQWEQANSRVVPTWGGSLHYCQQDVADNDSLNSLIAKIADDNQRLDGVVAAAGIQQITPAMEYTPEDVAKMLEVNYTGVFMTASAAARQMFKHKTKGASICLIASMSGLIANKGLLSPVYNSSKAGVIQLARNLAMEWSPTRPDGSGGIRVNCISPGHILTPMVLKNFEEVPGLREKWEAENMMGRLAETSEFKAAVLFLMGKGSSFMTGGNLVIDGGHTAW
ncbi:hypothetical protein QC763_116330 [Podospora pseudopauciseta]|uniref:Ketoreductase domain-containing protein n=1 Tax=Podospora pseudopauciseta TaxID=2093780 RepID=A0ABR0I173_9PEZI|nr:hypothetical protein QC763_116330 [Podospora pseudopauciseta]